MNLKSLLVGLAIFGIGDLFLYSCVYACDESPSYFVMCDVEAVAMDNSGASPSLAIDTVPGEAFAIDIIVEAKGGEICKTNPMLANGMYAMSPESDCISDYLVTYQNIIDLRIITLNDFNSSFTSGDDISTLFYRYVGGKYEPIKYEFNNASPSASYAQSTGFDISRLALLMTAPQYKGEHQFTVEIEFRSGLILSSTTPSIYLK